MRFSASSLLLNLKFINSKFKIKIQNYTFKFINRCKDMHYIYNCDIFLSTSKIVINILLLKQLEVITYSQDQF